MSTGGLFSRVKNWLGGENLSASDLDAEFNNIISNLTPAKLDNFSHTVSQMQQTISPGTVGSEYLAQNLSEEIQELRYMLQQVSGGAQWYSPPVTNLSVLAQELSSIYTSPANKIISGAKSSFDQPAFLTPTGTASVILKATSTNLAVDINNTLVTFPADITLANLTLGPSASNTASILDPTLSGGANSFIQGEGNTVIQIGGGVGGTIGSAITAKNGQGYCGFKVGSEYFIGEVSLNNNTVACSQAALAFTVFAPSHGLSNGDQVIFGGTFPAEYTNGQVYYVEVIDSNNFAVSATLGGSVITSTAGATSFTASPLKYNCIKNCFRGYFFDSSNNWIARGGITSGSSTITLCQLGWIFATYNGSTYGLDVTYNQPRTSDTQPSSPATGDYWLDLSVNEWKKYNGTSYVVESALLIGVTIQDSTTCQGARAFDFYNSFSDLNTMEVEYVDAATVRTNRLSQKASVYGTLFYFDYDNVKWLTGSSMDTGVSLAASTEYYCYLSDKGKAVISNVAPYTRRSDLLGFYHPAKPWRAIATFTTDGSNNVSSSTVAYQEYYGQSIPNNFITNSKLQPILPGTISPTFVDGSTIKMNPGGSIGIPTGGVTRPLLSSYGLAASSSTSTFSSTSTSFTSVISIGTFTVTGKPIWIGLIPDGNSTNPAYWGPASTAQVTWQITKNSGATVVGMGSFTGNSLNSVGSIWTIDNGQAATSSAAYQLYAKISSGSITFYFYYAKLMAYELA